MSESSKTLDFSKAWQMSDTVLVVESEAFHVHRKTLVLCSKTFAQMLPSDRELNNNNNSQFILEDKKASEIEELLTHIYSNSPKELTERNCYFLLDLAREYQIEKLVRRCERYLIKTLATISVGNSGGDVIDLLVLAQEFDLEELRKKCVDKAIEEVGWTAIQDHELYTKIELKCYREIAEGKMALLRWRLEEAEEKLAEVENKRVLESLCIGCASKAKRQDEHCKLNVGCVWASQGMIRIRWDCN